MPIICRDTTRMTASWSIATAELLIAMVAHNDGKQKTSLGSLVA